MSSNSDYGLYGQSGKHKATGLLPVVRCNCGGEPVITSNYDDTPGFRDTSYVLACSVCDKSTTCTSEINYVIDAWNKGAFHNHVCDYEMKFGNTESVSLVRETCKICGDQNIIVNSYPQSIFE